MTDHDHKSMFTIPVGHLLQSYPGDRQSLEFSNKIPSDTFEDIECVDPLAIRMDLIALQDGVEVVLHSITCPTLRYNDRLYDVTVSDVSRTYKQHFDPLAPDDIKFIDMKHSTIDITPILREEILIDCMSHMEE